MLIWSRTRGSTRYEVRTAGRVHRLYTNGIFHSQAHPERLVTGHLWDLLSLPALLLPNPQQKPQQALVLGVGGGTALRQLRGLGIPLVHGVELDPVHLYVARRFFGLKGPGLALHQDDARDWLRDAPGPPVDYLVDDLFGGQEGEPERAVAVDGHWSRQLLSRLAPGGILVINFPDQRTLRACALLAQAGLRRRFRAAWMLRHPRYDNAVGVFLRTTATPDVLRKRLADLSPRHPLRGLARTPLRIHRLA
ncbi:MAG TPA: oxidoreductase [Thioalkalivibrio sp.]|nr:oxidoreductase [Thioalkalivibrio sp.]